MQKKIHKLAVAAISRARLPMQYDSSEEARLAATRDSALWARFKLHRHRRSIRKGRLPGAEIAVVLSNLPDAAGLEAARKLAFPPSPSPPPGASERNTTQR